MNDNKEKWSRRLTKNLGLKIISFLFAVTLWLLVVNIDDPVVRWTYLDVPVTIKNAEVITSQGMIYEILDDTGVVPKVTVYAPRSIGENLVKSDIVATADMNTLNSLNTLQIEYSIPRVGSKVSDIRGSLDSVKISIENKKDIQKTLKTNITGEAPEGYVIGNVTPDKNLIRISGAESLVNQVSTANVNIDMSEFTSDIRTDFPVYLYDEDGKEVVGSTLTKDPENIMVTVEILPVKEVPLIFEASGDAADGYGLTGVITCEPQTIKIAGKKAVLNGINEIHIPAEALDADEITEDLTTEIDIRPYLPENVIMADKSSSVPVTVTVGVERESTAEFKLKAEDVEFINVPEGLTCSIEGLEEEYSVSVTGIRSEMSTVTARTLKASVDVANWMKEQEMRSLQPGRYSIVLQYNNPEHTRIDSPITATLVVSDGTQEDAAE